MARLFYQSLESDEEALSKLSHDNAPGQDSCYYDYYNIYNTQKTMYFGFYAHENILKLVEEINEGFQNIKIDVVAFKVFPYKTEIGMYTPDSEIFWENVPSTYTYCMFKIVLDNRYSENAKFTLTYILAEFLRGFCPEYKHFQNSQKIKSDFINNMIDAQNSSNYGAWMCCGYFYHKCERKSFDSLDNIELMNELCKDIEVNGEDNPSISKFFWEMEHEQAEIG